MTSNHDSTDHDKLRSLENSPARASSVVPDKENGAKRQRHVDDSKQGATKKLKEADDTQTTDQLSASSPFDLISICRDARIVDGREFPPGRGRDLGHELLSRYTTTVQHLDLDLVHFLAHGAKEEMEDLLQFLAQSTALVYFGVQGDRFSNTSIASSLLDGIAQSQQLCRLKWHLPVEPLTFRKVMTLPKLNELDIAFDFLSGGYEYTVEQRGVIAAAFKLNKALQKLALSVKGDEDTFEAILDALPKHATLRDLQCGPLNDSDTSDAEARAKKIAKYLRSAPTLDRLSMFLFDSNGDDMEQLLLGLEHPPGPAGGVPATRPLSLCLHLATLCDPALDKLFRFLEKRATKNGESRLRELCLVGDFGLSDVWSERLAASLMTQTAKAVVTTNGTGDQGAVDNSGRGPTELMLTFGSQIQTLCLDLDVHEHFLHNLTDDADQVVNLHTLELKKNLDGIARALNSVETDALPDNQRRLMEAYRRRNRHSDAGSYSVPMAHNVTDGAGGGGVTCVTATTTTQATVRDKNFWESAEKFAGVTMLNRRFLVLCRCIGENGDADESTEVTNDAAQSIV